VGKRDTGHGVIWWAHSPAGLALTLVWCTGLPRISGSIGDTDPPPAELGCAGGSRFLRDTAGGLPPYVGPWLDVLSAALLARTRGEGSLCVGVEEAGLGLLPLCAAAEELLMRCRKPMRFFFTSAPRATGR
jgi:hypothetical protein